MQGNVDLYDCTESIFKKHHIGTDVRLGRQPAAVTITVTPKIDTDGSVYLELSKPAVDLRSNSKALAKIRDLALHVFNVDIPAKIDDAMRKSIDPSLLKQTIPDLIPGVRPQVTQVRFADLGAGSGGAGAANDTKRSDY